MDTVHELSPLQQRLLTEYQRDMPVDVRPFASIAEQLEVGEDEVLNALEDLRSCGVLSRVGPVFQPGRAGASTLAAMAAPPDALERAARIVNGFDEVNHNYEREHEFNLWFVVTGESQARVQAVLDEICSRTGLDVLDLPLERSYHIDLGFVL